ncbi:hypothetical protein [Ruegeria sp. A3M17]|uniref:hypothetical protein n=1 Tax=Ruegeria sp. A3M17 TaxID=2267229 RepID=UPI000DEB6141|nr:hypothetical protein [Ruegeria sp. A3M17]RBW58709.1 hypothetical protein DS906_07860 [Ruegeria sp. A3M17]
MRFTSTFTIAALVFATTATAQSDAVRQQIEDAIGSCTAGSSGKLLRDLSRKWGTREQYSELFASHDAITCYSDHLGKEAKFLSSSGTYAVSTYVEKETMLQKEARLEKEKREEQRRRDTLKAADEARKAANVALVNGKVYRACVELSEKDPIAAYTNELCVNSFKANGDPS